MKKSVFTLFALLVCILSPIQAYEYFTIYFSDGTKSEAFYATDVDSICYSKLGLDSIEYTDWQVQEIYTCDSVYRYPLALIDSLSFKDVDVNKVAENIASIGNAVSPIYSQCNSAEDISTYLPEILSINGVDDAWTDNQSLFVKIKDFGTVSYLYPPQDIPVTESFIDDSSISYSLVHSIRRAASEDIVPDHDRTDAKSICIVNQQSKDQTRGNKIYVSTELDKYCSAMGMSVKIEPHPLPNFFENELYNYDILILMTHGNYDAAHGLHWFATGDELCVIKKHETINKDSVADILISRGYYNKYSTRDISYTCIPEVRNGDTCQVYYAQISNQFISKQKNKRFRNYGNVIVFNTACQSLKGSQNDAYNLAYAFGQKGARSYLGYNEADQIGTGASLLYVLRLLNGQSTEQAFNTLPNKWKEETFEYPEKSGKKVNPKLEHIHSTNYGIISPKTLSAEFGNEKVKIMGSIKILNPYGEEASKNEYGLIYSQSPNMDDCKVAKCELNYDEQTHNVIMEYTFKEGELIAKTTYYYCAYMYDGYSYCYGEVKEVAAAEPYVVVNNDTLTFYYDNKKEERAGKAYKIENYYDNSDGYNYPQWSNDSIGDSIKYAKFDVSFKNYRPESTAYWFFDLTKLSSIEHLEYLNTANVTDMSGMFSGCNSLTSLDLSSFNTANVTSMRGMFGWCVSLTSLDVSNFNTANVMDMSMMFAGGWYSLTSLDLSTFNTANVTDMSMMFYWCSPLTSLDLSSFNTANVTNMMGMFSECSGLTSLDLSNFNTANVTDMSWMFAMCSSLTSLDLSNFNTANVTDMSGMFADCHSLTSLDLSSFNTANVTDMDYMFRDCGSLMSLDIRNFVIKDGLRKSLIFDEFFYEIHLENIDARNIILEGDGGKYLFYYCPSVKSINMSNADTSKATNMRGMFLRCSSLTSLDLSSFNTANVTDMRDMFYECSSLKTIYAGDWDKNYCGGVDMFFGCNNLVGGKGTKIGKNLYGYNDKGNPLYYYCPSDCSAAHIDGGKDNPGLFTAK